MLFMTKKLLIEIEDNGELYFHGEDRLNLNEIIHIFKALVNIHCPEQKDRVWHIHPVEKRNK